MTEQDKLDAIERYKEREQALENSLVECPICKMRIIETEEVSDNISAWNTRNQWIDVKDRLPDTIGDYLAYDGNVIAWVFYNSEGKWCINVGFIKPTHWQPLPTAPIEHPELIED